MDDNKLEIDDSHYELPDGKIIRFNNKVIYDSAEILIWPDWFVENTLSLKD